MITKASNVVPIIFGVSATVGAAAGITSTGLQIAQDIQLQDQIKDQQELVQLQKELSRRQLAQYKKAEEAELREAYMYSKPVQGIGPISTLQMTTRSMVRQQQMPNMQTTRFGGSSVNMENLNLNQTTTPFRGSFENVNYHHLATA